jgi:hypothetical protein
MVLKIASGSVLERPPEVHGPMNPTQCRVALKHSKP